MSDAQEKSEDRKMGIKMQIATLSRLLGMIPSQDSIQIHEPMTQNNMDLSDWLNATRKSFLELSLLISEELDIGLQ